MNVFIREMKANRKALIIWCIGVVLLIASSMGKFAGLSASGQSINDLMAQMPQSMKAIMGGDFDLTTAMGYYEAIYIYLALMAAIHASMLGATIIAKEERDKTAEFLLVKPISRNKVITAKLSASFLNVLIFNIITLVTSILLVKKYSDQTGVIGDLTKLMLGMLCLQILFLSIGTVLAAFSKHPKGAPTRATGIILLTFMLSIAIDLNNNIAKLKYLTPFKYFEAKSLISVQGFNTVYVVLALVILIILFLLTYVFYNKRDMKV
ncbi:ABC-2 type transporter [Desulfosporosinus orientis DSM 765]|uniref:ABC-2 type transporter n=1 Tax=Desulfosporosinus orientis (strain ATCC 19365 / DSM 765 / NCIMB 8382 / VKM B-1628 / Singapore I) TaxID=768706 RepID=G7WAQ5_DESOD|nr:ABC transporter permease subunit [Desulfosporosinus orientis]AET67116.1 ABC-2 type transporter [Desulfosporosinus orientis DSM 765]